MLQTLHPAHKLLLQPRGASAGVGITKGNAALLEFREGQFGIFKSPREIPRASFIVDRQLFAGIDAILGIGNKLQPQRFRALRVALPLGQ